MAHKALCKIMLYKALKIPLIRPRKSLYLRIIRNIQRRGTVIFNNGAVHETWSDLVDCQR